MIKLKEKFSKKGVVYEQVYRDGVLAIYELSTISVDDPSEIIRWYEVFKITVHKADKYHPDEYELYPYDESFGLFAWCCSTESCVGKVLYEHFPNHPITKQIMPLASGTYKVNNDRKPYFKISQPQLSKIIASISSGA